MPAFERIREEIVGSDADSQIQALCKLLQKLRIGVANDMSRVETILPGDE